VIAINEIPDTKIILEAKTLRILVKVRQTIANGTPLKFEETYEPPTEAQIHVLEKQLIRTPKNVAAIESAAPTVAR
jgi:hypothetical protein